MKIATPKLHIDDSLISEIFETEVPGINIHMRDRLTCKINCGLAANHFMDFLYNVLKENKYYPSGTEFIRTARQIFETYSKKLRLNSDEKEEVWASWLID